MQAIPSGDNTRGSTFTVGDFYEAARSGNLELALVAGGEASLKHSVQEPMLSRPSFALTGFFKHFASDRLQLFGRGELDYLESLEPMARERAFEALVEHGAYAFVFSAGTEPTAEMKAYADAHAIAVFVTSQPSFDFGRQAVYVLGRLAAPKTTMYGTTLEVAGLGVMIEGDPGVGKSETALGLIKRGCALVADDLTCIRRDFGSDRLFASASDATSGFMEIRGIGIMHVPSIFGVTSVRSEKRLQLVITFRKLQDVRAEIDRIGQDRSFKRILGVDIPNIVIPVSEGRDLVNLVETAAQEQKLLETGFDPVEELQNRLRKRASAHENLKKTH